MFERRLLIGAALCTAGRWYCVVDCGIARRQQSEPAPISPAAPLWDCLVTETSSMPVLHHPAAPPPILFADFYKPIYEFFLYIDIFYSSQLFFLFLCYTECAFISSTNTSSSMLLKFTQSPSCSLSALRTNSPWGEKTETHAKPSLPLPCLHLLSVASHS